MLTHLFPVKWMHAKTLHLQYIQVGPFYTEEKWYKGTSTFKKPSGYIIVKWIWRGLLSYRNLVWAIYVLEGSAYFFTVLIFNIHEAIKCKFLFGKIHLLLKTMPKPLFSKYFYNEFLWYRVIILSYSFYFHLNGGYQTKQF